MNKFEPNVESWEIGKIIPYALNSKKHPDNQIDKIAASMVEFGMDVPVVVDGDGVLIKGHGRRLAAIKLGLTHLPVIIRTDLSPAQVKAARIADNRISQSDWDTEFLELELKQLEEMDFDLELTGFDQRELDAFFAEKTEGLTDPDDVPETPIKPVTVLGDVWVLGNHRIVCGDSTDAETVTKVLNGVKPHLMVTDPPYGVGYDASWRLSAMPEKNTKNGSHGKVMTDSRADWSEAWSLFPGEVAYVWHGERQLIDLAHQLINCGLETRNLIVWAKSQLVIGRGHYHSQHETCWYAVRKKATGHWAGDRKQSTIWQIAKPIKSETGHSTQKPIECMKRPIENNSSPGQAVYEPFSGSGTTIIAGEMTGRSVHAIELNPAYVDVTIKRWQDFTGKEAVLDGAEMTFDEVAESRMSQALSNSVVE
jgi:DNA modification methylase